MEMMCRLVVLLLYLLRFSHSHTHTRTLSALCLSTFNVTFTSWAAAFSSHEEYTIYYAAWIANSRLVDIHPRASAVNRLNFVCPFLSVLLFVQSLFSRISPGTTPTFLS
jgi:hypothetical protein